MIRGYRPWHEYNVLASSLASTVQVTDNNGRTLVVQWSEVVHLSLQ